MTKITRYVTRQDAIYREIIEPIENGEARADEFDIDAIADEVLGGYDEGFACVVDHDEFWAAVERHVLPTVDDLPSIVINEDPADTMRLALSGPRWSSRAYWEAESAGHEATMRQIETEQHAGELAYFEAWKADAIRIGRERGFDVKVVWGDYPPGTTTNDWGGRRESAEELIWQAAHDATPLPEGW
jgi:hypothetical protein